MKTLFLFAARGSVRFVFRAGEVSGHSVDSGIEGSGEVSVPFEIGEILQSMGPDSKDAVCKGLDGGVDRSVLGAREMELRDLMLGEENGDASVVLNKDFIGESFDESEKEFSTRVDSFLEENKAGVDAYFEKNESAGMSPGDDGYEDKKEEFRKEKELEIRAQIRNKERLDRYQKMHEKRADAALFRNLGKIQGVFQENNPNLVPTDPKYKTLWNAFLKKIKTNVLKDASNESIVDGNFDIDKYGDLALNDPKGVNVGISEYFTEEVQTLPVDDSKGGETFGTATNDSARTPGSRTAAEKRAAALEKMRGEKDKFKRIGYAMEVLMARDDAPSYEKNYGKKYVKDRQKEYGKMSVPKKLHDPDYMPNGHVALGNEDINKVKGVEYKEAYRQLVDEAGLSVVSSTKGDKEDGSSRASNRTCLDGLRQTTIDGALKLQRLLRTSYVITGGTERGHSAGLLSHLNGFKLDVRSTDAGGKAIKELSKSVLGYEVRLGQSFTYDLGDGITAKFLYHASPHAHFDIAFVPNETIDKARYLEEVATFAKKGGDRIVTYPGGKKKVNGSRSWRNNNEGNLEYGRFAKKHGAIGTDGRFAIFPDEETGRSAKIALLKGPNYRNLPISSAIARYAPHFENDSNRYARIVSGAAGVSASTRMSSLTDVQFRALVAKMRDFEGWKPGRIV